MLLEVKFQAALFGALSFRCCQRHSSPPVFYLAGHLILAAWFLDRDPCQDQPCRFCPTVSLPASNHANPRLPPFLTISSGQLFVLTAATLSTAGNFLVSASSALLHSQVKSNNLLLPLHLLHILLHGWFFGTTSSARHETVSVVSRHLVSKITNQPTLGRATLRHPQQSSPVWLTTGLAMVTNTIKCTITTRSNSIPQA